MSAIVDELPLPARPRAERESFPLPTPADVVRLIMLDDWSPRTEREATLAAAFIAGAACAKLHYFQAADIRVGEHWSREKPNYLLIPDSPPRPAALLPIAAFAFRRLADAYGKVDGDFLFGSNDVSNLFRRQNLWIRMLLLGNRLDVDTGFILRQLHAFYDHAIPPETSPEMKFALTGPSYPGGTFAHIEPYGIPVRKLRAFLRANHPLNRPAGAYTGTRGRNWIARQRQNLPERPTRGRREETAAFGEDPVVLALRVLDWPEDKAEWRAFRLALRDEYFDYLDGLRAAGKLGRRELAFLFKAPTSTTDGWYRMLRYRVPAHEAVERPEEEWKRIFREAYERRGPDEKPHAVWWRTASAEKSPVRYQIVMRWWKDAGLVKRRRGRPRKRPGSDLRLLSPRGIRKRLRIGATVPPKLVAAGHLKKAAVAHPGHGGQATFAVAAEDVERFDAKYVSLSALTRGSKRGWKFRTVLKELEVAGARPAFDPKKVGTRFYRRADLAKLGLAAGDSPAA